MDKQDKLGNELSKGMMQKVSICCALMIQPDVILLDEPMVGLDPAAIKELKQVILELKDKLSLEEAVEHKLSQVPDEQTETSGIKAEAAMALTALGYSSSEALKAISRVEIAQDMEVETLLKLALKNMAAV